MKCPYCGNTDTRVVDSRTMDDATAIRRRRACDTCGERFTTYERVDTIPLAVIKRDRTRESFDSSKLLDGIVKSCNKRPISMAQIEAMIDAIVKDVENAAHNSMSREIESREIGDLVMSKLKQLDEVAYVRFASVYKQFTDIGTFMDELSQLLRDKK